METRLLSTSSEHMKLAARIIAAGGLVAFPTETVYGLGGDALNPAAATLLYEAKGRPQDNPLIVHVHTVEEAESLAGNLPAAFDTLADRFWPGPLTLIVPKHPRVPDETTGGLPTVALRMPDHPTALELIRLADTPIAGPSANLSGRPSPTRWTHVRDDLSGRIDAIITGGPSAGGIESTVLDLTADEPVILRPGLVSPQDIEHVLGRSVAYDAALLEREAAEHSPKSPGTKYRHYAPSADMVVFQGPPEAVLDAIDRRKAAEQEAGRRVGVLAYDGTENRLVARDFFAHLRDMDATGVDVILAAAIRDDDPIAFSIMNRMLKAAGYRIEEVRE